MSFKRIFSCCLFFSLLSSVFFSCASSPVQAQPTTSSSSLKEAEAAANDAARRLEEAMSGGSSKNTSSTNTSTTANASNTNSSSSSSRTNTPSAPVPPAQETRGGTQPRWVTDPYSVYPREQFIAVVGTGANRTEAERNGFAALVAYFGQSVRSNLEVTALYQEAVNRGVVSASENTRVREEIALASSMDKLIGAEIGNVWDSGRGLFYVVAYLDKATTVLIYTDMAILNNYNINLLTSMNSAQRNTLDGYARFKFAAMLAGLNSEYASVINLSGGSSASLNLRTVESLNLEAADIIKNITVTVKVTNDRSNRIQDAFAKVISAEGLRTRGNNPPYTLEVTINNSEVKFPGNDYIHCRMELSANLIENSTNSSLLPYSFNDRAGHNSYSNAETQVFVNAERSIASRYPAIFKEFLNSLLPW